MENTNPTAIADEHYYGDLAREYATLQDRVAPDLARIDEIKKLMRGLDYGTHDVAGLKVSVARNSRLDAAAFAAKYPVPAAFMAIPDANLLREFLDRYPIMQNPEMYTTVPTPQAIAAGFPGRPLYKPAADSAAIKKNLAPAEIETLSNAGEPRVTIK